jgi:hypothetical protein
MRSLTTRILTLSLLSLAVACGDLGVVPNAGDDDPGDPGGAPDAGPTPDPGSSRVTLGLQALYTFDEGSGSVVGDSSGIGAPLDLIAADQTGVEWIPGGGLEITAPSLLITAGPASKIGLACAQSNAITMEAWVRPAAVNQTGPARILSFSDGNNSRNFHMAQDNALADFRLRTTDTDDNGTPALQSEVAVFDSSIVHLVYTRSGLDDEAQIWVDGQLQVAETLAGSFANWDMSYSLALANEVNGERPWRGEIYLAAVYCRDLSPAEIFQNYQAGYE